MEKTSQSQSPLEKKKLSELMIKKLQLNIFIIISSADLGFEFLGEIWFYMPLLFQTLKHEEYQIRNI